MDESKFLILGAYGQLGKALATRYPRAIVRDHDELDITNQQALKKQDWSSVEVILNAAAYTNVDAAETSAGRKTSWLVNGHGPANLAKIAIENNILVVHISSEYVFDGTLSPHIENEPFSPLGVYAQTKAAGDLAIATTPKHYIIRTSWLIGEGSNFVRTMIGLANKNVAPKVVDDQIGRLTFTDTLVDGVDHLLKTGARYGTYNLSNEGPPASWADITRVIFNGMGRDDLTVTGISTKEYYKDKLEAAPRPLESTLDLSKITRTGLNIPNWQQKLAEYVKGHKE